MVKLVIGFGILLTIAVITTIVIVLLQSQQSEKSDNDKSLPEDEPQFVEGDDNCGRIVGVLKPGHISYFQINSRTHDFTMSCKLKVNKLKLEPEARLYILTGHITVAPLTYGGMGLRVHAFEKKRDMELSVPDSEWFHLVYVQRADSALVYINGQLEKKQEAGYTSKTEIINEVGISGNTQWHQIKDIILCSRALNLYEIQGL